MATVLALVSCILLALVAGLLLLLAQLLRGMRVQLREAPLLAEKLAQQLLAVRQGLEQTRGAAFKLAPELVRHLQEGQQLLHDLKLLTGRGEQVARRLEEGGSAGGAAPVEARREADGEPIADDPTADPLAGLLADLGEAAGTVRRAPSQAEVALRTKEGAG
jgi:hypothetical protein